MLKALYLYSLLYLYAFLGLKPNLTKYEVTVVGAPRPSNNI